VIVRQNYREIASGRRSVAAMLLVFAFAQQMPWPALQ